MPANRYNSYYLHGRFGANTTTSDEFNVNMYIDKRFTDEQTTIIRDSVNRMRERLLPYTCFSNDPSHTDSRDPMLPFPVILVPGDQEHAMNIALLRSLGKEPNWTSWRRPLFIDRFSETPADPSGIWTLGLAQVNLFGDSQVLSIQLNGDALGADSVFSRSQDTDLWAGIIVHEILHNLGWRHLGDNPCMIAFQKCVSGESFGLVPVHEWDCPVQ